MECRLLLVLYVNMIKSALSLFGISVCPDVYLYLNSARSPVIFHLIQVFLPQVNWPLSNNTFRKEKKKKKRNRGVFVCVRGLRGTKERKNEGNRVGSWI